MPRIDVECSSGHRSEVMRPLAMYPATPDCPTCGASTVQIHLPTATQWSVDPVIVYKMPDGSFRFPGETTTLSTAKYDRLGGQRIELRGAADVRRFEHVMDRREYIRASRRVERMQQMREHRESETRGEMRRQMEQGWRVPEVDKEGRRTGRILTLPSTEYGRAVARATMRRNDHKPRESAKEAGFHVDVYSNDHSNRMESRDAQGRRRRD